MLRFDTFNKQIFHFHQTKKHNSVSSQQSAMGRWSAVCSTIFWQKTEIYVEQSYRLSIVQKCNSTSNYMHTICLVPLLLVLQEYAIKPGNVYYDIHTHQSLLTGIDQIKGSFRRKPGESKERVERHRHLKSNVKFPVGAVSSYPTSMQPLNA